jgi:hypothetical protein
VWPVMTEDIQNYLSCSDLLESSCYYPMTVTMPFLRPANDRLVLKESHNIHVNQQNIEEAQCQIKKSQLAIERAQRSLVDDIRAVDRSSNTEKVPTGTSTRDIRAAKRRAEVSPTILFFVSVIKFFCTNHFFMCQPFLNVNHFFCANHFLCVSHFFI